MRMTASLDSLSPTNTIRNSPGSCSSAVVQRKVSVHRTAFENLRSVAPDAHLSSMASERETRVNREDATITAARPSIFHLLDPMGHWKTWEFGPARGDAPVGRREMRYLKACRAREVIDRLSEDHPQ